MSKDRKLLIILLVVIILALSFALTYLNTDLFKKAEVIDKTIADNIRFYREYPDVAKENIIKYADFETVYKVLTEGSGIVFFGFPACEWCQVYAPVLNEVAIEKDAKQIYYYNIKEIRDNNTDEYKQLALLLSKYLNEDDKGNKRIYMPDTYFVKKGKIVGHNNSMSTLSGIKSSEYFDEEKRKSLKEDLGKLVELVYKKDCNDTIYNEGC